MTSAIGDDWPLFAAVHQLLDAHQSLPDLSARMNVGEVVLAKTLRDKQRHRQRVPEGKRSGRAGGRHQIHRARFLGNVAVQRNICCLGECGAAIAGDGNHASPDPLDRFQKPQQLLGFAAVRQRNHHIVSLQDAEVAVNSFSWVQEERGRACAREGRCDLAADNARLAHPGDDRAPAAVEENPYGLFEPVVEPIDERQDRGRLCLQDLARQCKVDGHDAAHARAPETALAPSRDAASIRFSFMMSASS